MVIENHENFFKSVNCAVVGLDLMFDSQQDEYINTMIIPGIQLFIQDQEDPLLLGSMGLILSPGLVYHITITGVGKLGSA